GLPGVPPRVRVRDGVGAVHHHHGLHDHPHPVLEPVGALPGRLPIATVAAPPAQRTRSAVPRTQPPGVRRKRRLLKIANHSVAIALMFMLRLLFVVLTSFMTAQQAGSSEIWPHPWVWGNYAKVFDLFPAWTYLRNTIEYAVLSTVGVLLSSVLVAYALSRMEWRRPRRRVPPLPSPPPPPPPPSPA